MKNKFCWIGLSLLFMSTVSCGAASRSSQEDSIFNLLHTLSESFYDGNGSWGKRQFGYRMALRDSYWRADVYHYQSVAQTESTTLFHARANAVYQYLMSVQSQSRTGVFGFPADVKNPEFGSLIKRIVKDCPECIKQSWVVTLPGENIAELYYDHGYALTSMARAYLGSKDENLLPSIKKAADWALDKPLSKNVNYLSALSKGLSYAYAATDDSRYLERAVYLHKTGIIPFLSPTEGKALDAHNQQLEYHGFIVSGLIALKNVLPMKHAFQPTLDQYLSLSIDHMQRRNLTEAAPFGVTWPGTNLLAWFELSKLRALNPKEKSALNRCIKLIRSYRSEIQSQSGFVLQKALYSYFFIGLVD